MKRIKSILALALATLLTSFAQAAEPAIGGYCPVCYLATGEAVKGSSKLTSEHSGKTYYFASEDARKAFDKNPAKFLPAYDGLCAYCVSAGKKAAADPTIFTIHNGRLFLNKDKEIDDLFRKDLAANIAKADKKWKKMNKKRRAYKNR